MNGAALIEALRAARRKIARAPNTAYSGAYCPKCVLSASGFKENYHFKVWSPSGDSGHAFSKADGLRIIDNSIAAIQQGEDRVR